MKRLFAFCAGVLLFATQLGAQTTYYFRGGTVNNVNNWRTTRSGASGTAPTSFATANDNWDFNEVSGNISGWTVAGNILNTRNGGATPTTATLTLDNNASFTIGGNITTANMAFSIGAGSTFTYNGGNGQSVAGLSYANLAIAGSGTKAAAAAIAMNGTLTINAGVTFNMGANQLTGTTGTAGTGTLQTANTSANALPANQTWSMAVVYNGANQTVATGTYNSLSIAGSGIKSAGGVISINNAMSIASGVTFNTTTSNYAISFLGNFTNSGTFTANASDIQISGTQTQTIAGFTTNGRVTMDKTAGTATFSSAINAAALTLNGAGGTLNMGTGLTHNISTNWVVSAGVMQVSTSTINVGGSVDLTLAGGGIGAPGGDAEINANAGTVRFNASSVAQQVPAGTYFNLELAGGGNARKKTIAGGVTIQNNLSVAGDAWLELGDNNITVGAAGNTGITVDGTVVINGLGRLLKTPGGGSKKLQLNATGKLDITADNAGLPDFDTYTFDPLSTVTYGAATNQSIGTTPAYGILAATGAGTKSHAANLSAHAIVIGAGTTLATTNASAVLTVQGADGTGSSWDNSGTYSPAVGSTVLFSGSVAQTIKGVGTTFSQLAVNKASGLLQVNSPVNVAATLQLQNGKIATGAQSITLQNPVAASQLTGGSATAYIYSTGAGRLRRNNLPAGAGPFSFPIGTASLYMPVTVEPFDASSDFAVNTFQGLTQDGTPSGPAFVNKNPVVDAIWNIDRPAGSGEAEIKVSWDASLEGSAFSTFANNQIGISHFTMGSWQLAMGSGDNTANTATATFSSFSPFAVGKTGTVLPVSFIGIKAFEKQGGAQIEWTVAADEQVATYQIERSNDGQKFSKIGTINGRQSVVQTKYEFLDQAALQGTSYYRIVSVEKNGVIATSQVIRLNLKKSGKETILYPNPVKGNYFSLQSSGLERGAYNIRMMNANGQQLLQLRMEHSGGALSQIIRMPSNIQPGLYHLQMENAGNMLQVWKLWVQ